MQLAKKRLAARSAKRTESRKVELRSADGGSDSDSFTSGSEDGGDTSRGEEHLWGLSDVEDLVPVGAVESEEDESDNESEHEVSLDAEGASKEGRAKQTANERDGKAPSVAGYYGRRYRVLKEIKPRDVTGPHLTEGISIPQKAALGLFWRAMHACSPGLFYPSALANLDEWLPQEQRDSAGLIMARWLERQSRELEARRAAGQEDPAAPRPNRRQRRSSKRKAKQAQPTVTSHYKKKKGGGKAKSPQVSARPACHLRRAALALYAFASGKERIVGLEVPDWMKELTLEEILEALEAAYEILTAYGRDVLDAFLSGNALTILGDADFFLSRASQTLNSEVAGAVLHGGSLVLGGGCYHTVELADGKRQKDYTGRTICHPFRLVEHWSDMLLKQDPDSLFKKAARLAQWWGTFAFFVQDPATSASEKGCRQRAIHEVLLAIMFGTFSEETVSYSQAAVASYRAWRERHGLVDFTANVRGANLTPCFEKPEAARVSPEVGASFSDAVLRSATNRAGIYRLRLIPCLADGRTLPHTRFIALIQISEVVQHNAISSSLQSGLRVDIDYETTPLWNLFGARVGDAEYREIRRRFKSGQLLLFLREGTGTSFPGCVEGEADLFWDLELVCRSARDDEPGEVRLLFVKSPMSVPQRALAYQCFAWLPPPRQLVRLQAQRATLERMQKRRPSQEVWDTLDEDLQMGIDGVFSIGSHGELRWGDTVIETMVASEIKGSVGQEFREANGLTHLAYSGRLKQGMGVPFRIELLEAAGRPAIQLDKQFSNAKAHWGARTFRGPKLGWVPLTYSMHAINELFDRRQMDVLESAYQRYDCALGLEAESGEEDTPRILLPRLHMMSCTSAATAKELDVQEVESGATLVLTVTVDGRSRGFTMCINREEVRWLLGGLWPKPFEGQPVWFRIRALNRRSIDELEMELSRDKKDWRPKQDFEVGSSARQQAWNYALLARETDFARGIVWSDRIEPAELLPAGMSRAEWREKWTKKPAATAPQPGTAASAPAPSAPAQAPTAPAPAASASAGSASAPTPAAPAVPAPVVVQARGPGAPSRMLPSSNAHQPELHQCMVPRSKFATHVRGHCAFDGVAVQEDYPVHRGWMALRLELWHAAASLPAEQRDRLRAKLFPGGAVPVGQAWDDFADECEEAFYMDEELLPFVRTHLQRSIVVIHEDNVALSHTYLFPASTLPPIGLVFTFEGKHYWGCRIINDPNLWPDPVVEDA